MAGHCYVKQGKYEQALDVLGEQNPDHLLPSDHNSRRKLHGLGGKTRLQTKQVPHRNGASGSGVGGSLRRDRIEHSEERDRDREQAQKDIQYEAVICHLRGLCYSRRRVFDRAKDCFLKAVKIDVQCYEAFDQLMQNSLLTPKEELQLLEELDFDSIALSMPTEEPSLPQEAAHFTKLLYTTRLSKYASSALLSDATETLATHYNLSRNTDLLLSRAETLYTQCRFQEALAITDSILNDSRLASPHASHTTGELAPNLLGHPPSLYPLHLACLYETSSLTALFHLSHLLSQHAPHEPYTYLAIATYYLSIRRIPEARRFFSKASEMDHHSAPAWIGFAHTFAAEGEHDQAIAAYGAAERVYHGSHLPQLFIGMQQLALNQIELAYQHCLVAWQMSSGEEKTAQDSFAGPSQRGFDADAANMRLDNSSPELPVVGTGPGVGRSNSYFNNNNDKDNIAVVNCGDPLVLNECAVILYQRSLLEQNGESTSNTAANQDLNKAILLFRQSLALVAHLGWNQACWVATRSNLAHALRRSGKYTEALAELDECVRICTGAAVTTTVAVAEGGERGRSTASGAAASIGLPASSLDPSLLGNLHTTRGLIMLSLERPHDAVVALHEAVRLLGRHGENDVSTNTTTAAATAAAAAGGSNDATFGGAGSGGGGGSGIAAQLLSRAVEIWGTEMAKEDRNRSLVNDINGDGHGQSSTQLPLFGVGAHADRHHPFNQQQQQQQQQQQKGKSRSAGNPNASNAYPPAATTKTRMPLRRQHDSTIITQMDNHAEQLLNDHSQDRRNDNDDPDGDDYDEVGNDVNGNNNGAMFNPAFNAGGGGGGSSSTRHLKNNSISNSNNTAGNEDPHRIGQEERARGAATAGTGRTTGTATGGSTTNATTNTTRRTRR